MIKLIPYAEIQRDENGYWIHPDFDTIAKPKSDGEVTGEFLAAHDTYFYLLDGENSVANENYFEKDSPDISMWSVKPKEGWFLLSINDSDDGPVAHYFKPKPTIELARNIAILNEYISLLEKEVKSISDIERRTESYKKIYAEALLNVSK